MRRTLLLSAGVLAAAATGLAAQQPLEAFSYDNLRLRGGWVELGVITSDRLDGTPVYGLRLDLGEFAPRLRLLLGGTYFRSDFRRSEIRRFERQLAGVVEDPDSNFSINLGPIRWSDFQLDLDLQYQLVRGRSWTPYLGLGAGAHIRNGSGRAINGTFVEDALDMVGAGLGATIGLEAFLTRSVLLNLGVRGVLSSDLNTIGIFGGVGFGSRRR